MKRSLVFAIPFAVVTVSSSASAIDRDEVLARAKAFSFHPWTCANANLTASCSGAYQSVYAPGDYMGLPYDWGGYMTLFDFDQQIKSGNGAGSYPNDGVLGCTAGLDCSGFVSKAWDAGHYSTSTVHQTSSAIDKSAMLPGDIFNEAGYHMAMYSHTLANGEPVMYESVGYNVHLSHPGWSWVDGYVPRRYSKITGTTAGNPIGTSTNPIPISSFPYTDQRDTTQAVSDVLDGCGLAPDKKETGPEYIYEVTLSSPGQLSAMVQDDAGVDIDVHLYTSTNSGDCLQRHDTNFTHPVDCGTYYVVADTFKGSQEQPGAYTLTVDFAPSGGNCGSGPAGYDFEGQLGDPCAYPGDESLPFCNPNLGAQTCIYTSTTSWCSAPCAGNSDCAAIEGGCCAELNPGELYCMTADYCGDVPPEEEPEEEDPMDPEGDPATGGAGGTSSIGAGAGNPSSGSAGDNVDEDDDGSSSSSSCSYVPSKGNPLAGLALLCALGLVARRRRDPS